MFSLIECLCFQKFVTIQNISIIQPIDQFIFNFQQGGGNAEKFDYVSMIQYNYKNVTIFIVNHDSCGV